MAGLNLVSNRDISHMYSMILMLMSVLKYDFILSKKNTTYMLTTPVLKEINSTLERENLHLYIKERYPFLLRFA